MQFLSLVVSLYPATLKSAGYYVIPSIQKIAFEFPSVCMFVQQRNVSTLSWEHFFNQFSSISMKVYIGKDSPGIADA